MSQLIIQNHLLNNKLFIFFLIKINNNLIFFKNYLF